MAGNSYRNLQWQLNRIVGKYDLIILADRQFTEWDELCKKYGVFARRRGVWPITVDFGTLCARALDEGKSIAVILFKGDYTDLEEWDLKFFYLTDLYHATFFHFGHD